MKYGMKNNWFDVTFIEEGIYVIMLVKKDRKLIKYIMFKVSVLFHIFV